MFTIVNWAFKPFFPWWFFSYSDPFREIRGNENDNFDLDFFHWRRLLKFGAKNLIKVICMRKRRWKKRFQNLKIFLSKANPVFVQTNFGDTIDIFYYLTLLKKTLFISSSRETLWNIVSLQFPSYKIIKTWKENFT